MFFQRYGFISYEPNLFMFFYSFFIEIYLYLWIINKVLKTKIYDNHKRKFV